MVFQKRAVQRAAAGDQVDARQHCGQQRLHPLESRLHVGQLALGHRADRPARQSVEARHLGRCRGDQACLCRAERDRAVPHIGNRRDGSVQDRRARAVELGQHDVRQDAGVLLSEQAGQRHRCGGACDGLGRHG